MLVSPLCTLLGIRYPILQGGMAWIADAHLASAVSNAGGLGIVSAMNADAGWLREEIRKTRTMTEKPFGVNIMLMSPFADEVAKVVAEERIPVVTTGAGDPSRYMKSWLAAGIRVIPVVASTAVAKLVRRAGASAVIAEGGESGGHVGDLTTMVLVPQVCDCVDIPVIAAGGIADGRGMAAAFMLGAVGVQVGTRFLAANECTVHQNYKDRILRAKDIGTITTGKKLGHPVRCLKTPFSRRYLAMENDAGVGKEELEAFGAGALRLAAKEGDEINGCFMAGQAAAMVKAEQPAAEIIEEMASQAELLLRGGTRWVS
ncbi:nitronate monooxygenase [Papillibacter cinnamivorans]|uniref:Probable nitronate monooxygenase n=1 Tax=Papillibacter cinnamivorans DSM 12816 TaxID=1122930 RepID=A0A1W2AHH1_9FIRM|nr:nitronate monooxygenase [Papillibacter cinnamivorans]SMC60063.1 enoyl-[acyl-carrier protein] reductase II [Papillibacter cinnamivorans DSM 12816]